MKYQKQAHWWWRATSKQKPHYQMPFPQFAVSVICLSLGWWCQVNCIRNHTEQIENHFEFPNKPVNTLMCYGPHRMKDMTIIWTIPKHSDTLLTTLRQSCKAPRCLPPLHNFREPVIPYETHPLFTQCSLSPCRTEPTTSQYGHMNASWILSLNKVNCKSFDKPAFAHSSKSRSYYTYLWWHINE